MNFRKRYIIISVVFLTIYYFIGENGGMGKLLIEFIVEKSKYIKYINEPVLKLATDFVPENIEVLMILLSFYLCIYFVIKYKQPILNWHYSTRVGRLHYEIYHIEYEKLIKLVFNIVAVASIQMFYLYNNAVEYGKCSTGRAIRRTYGPARENAVMALFGGGTLADNAGGKALGYESFFIIFIYVLITLYFVKIIKLKLGKYIYKR